MFPYFHLIILQTNTIFLCYKCDKSFSSSDDLTQHQATHNTEEKPFRCAHCKKNFFTFTEVRVQQATLACLLILGGGSIVYCLWWLFNVLQLNKHRRYECIERRCPCRDCGALFPSPSRLRSHRIAVHPQRPVVADDVNTYQCCKCSQGFQTEEDLLQHQEKYASNLNCDVKPPGKKRGRKPKYAAHLGTIDTKVKQEDGEGCDDSTTEGCPSNELQTELKIPCSEADCDLVFPSVTALRAHKREKHGPPPCIGKKQP